MNFRDNENLTDEQKGIIEEGQALGRETDLAVLAVAFADKVTGTGWIPDIVAAKAIGAATYVFMLCTVPRPSAVARPPKR